QRLEDTATMRASAKRGSRPPPVCAAIGAITVSNDRARIFAERSGTPTLLPRAIHPQISVAVAPPAPSRRSRGLAACRQMEHRRERRGVKALLESRLGFWLRGGLGPDIHACVYSRNRPTKQTSSLGSPFGSSTTSSARLRPTGARFRRGT